MMSIFQSNSVPLKQYDKLRGKDLGSAIFPNISRINHSCCPNSVLSYNLDTEECEVLKLPFPFTLFQYIYIFQICQVRCTKDLKENEEITLAYVDPLNIAADRQKLLQVK